MSKRIFDNDGLRVIEHLGMLRVEITVIGGDWTMSRGTVRRLRDALTRWLDGGPDE